MMVIDFYRLTWLLAVQTRCIALDREQHRAIGGAVIVHASQHVPPDSRDLEGAVQSYTDWMYGYGPKPEWA